MKYPSEIEAIKEAIADYTQAAKKIDSWRPAEFDALLIRLERLKRAVIILENLK